MNYTFNGIPQSVIAKIYTKPHVTPSDAVRAIHKAKIKKSDFKPTFVQNPSKSACLGDYSMSLFRTLDEMNFAMGGNEYVAGGRNYYAFGSPNGQNGYVHSPNVKTGHIDYFLDDYNTYDPNTEFKVGGKR